MKRYRVERVNNLLFRELTGLIQSEISDSRLGEVGVYITGVETTPDLKQATVFVRIEADNMEAQEDALDALESASGYLRREIGKVLTTFNTPKLLFKLDRSKEYGDRIDSILEELRKSNQISDSVPDDLEMD